MKTFIHYLCILISVLTIASCENDLPFNVKDNPPKLVMNALINADSLTNIFLYRLSCCFFRQSGRKESASVFRTPCLRFAATTGIL